MTAPDSKDVLAIDNLRDMWANAVERRFMKRDSDGQWRYARGMTNGLPGS